MSEQVRRVWYFLLRRTETTTDHLGHGDWKHECTYTEHYIALRDLRACAMKSPPGYQWGLFMFSVACGIQSLAVYGPHCKEMSYTSALMNQCTLSLPDKCIAEQLPFLWADESVVETDKLYEEIGGES